MKRSYCITPICACCLHLCVSGSLNAFTNKSDKNDDENNVCGITLGLYDHTRQAKKYARLRRESNPRPLEC